MQMSSGSAVISSQTRTYPSGSSWDFRLTATTEAPSMALRRTGTQITPHMRRVKQITCEYPKRRPLPLCALGYRLAGDRLAAFRKTSSIQSRYDSHHLISLESTRYCFCTILRTMKIPSLNPQQDRAAGSLLGAFIGHAMGLGPHCYYALDEHHRDY